MYLQGYVKGRGVYTGASYINYCPMCGRKLNKGTKELPYTPYP